MAIDRSLLDRFIHHQCTPEEMAEVSRLLEESPQLLDDYLQEMWNEEVTAHMPEDMMQAIAAHLQINGADAAVPALHKRRSWIGWAAAAVLLLLGLGGWLWQQRNTTTPNHLLVVTTAAKNYQLVLPDKSTVWMKANSQLAFDTIDFGRSNRTITLLNGEAFFDIEQDAAHPFVVVSGKVQTRVLGTAFSVRHASPEEVLVTVSAGKVAVDHLQQQLDILLPGKQITVNQQTGRFSEQQVPVWLAAAWKESRLQLDNASFAELKMAMEIMYGIRLESSNDKVRRQTYNILLNKYMPAQEVVRVLGQLNRLAYKQLTDTTFLIY
ncbi:MAG: FecR domain-containing protein [Chitinophaga sp.]|uniref:FecR family protein n=1 Tax=Chitinophaga sp. TaxID=1869181 RepID=UPI001B28C5AA|nr:FecR domain-containing protein [Chitinophaga sp.]MBO9730725.1 FecR domain-containing protein [Chitinophaga sp.]